MTCRNIFALLLLILTSANAADLDYASISPPVEARAIWLNANAIPKTAPEIKRLIGSYREANINVVFPEIIARGYTVYKSKLLPRDPRFRNAIDPLPLIIEEAHLNGIEVHPWVWVFRVGYTNDRGGILAAHPDWAELSVQGKDLSPSGGLWISPAVPAARDFVASLLEELVRDFDIDGLHLDYIRYESQSSAPYGYCQESATLFKKQYGITPEQAQPFSIEQYFWHKFRERQINAFVQRIALQTRAIKPHVMISAAVSANITSARQDRLQNWTNWLDNRWLDFVVPMAYSSRDSYFSSLMTSISSAAGCKFIAIIGIAPYRHENTTQTLAQIAVARECVPGGQALFAASSIKPELLPTLKAGPYARPAAVPFRNTSSSIEVLRRRACRLNSDGNLAEADFLLRTADNLAGFLTHRASPAAYVSPTPPPLKIVEEVQPLPELTAQHTSSVPLIDGSLDDWKWVNSLEALLCCTNEGDPVEVQTSVRVAYDSDYLYVAFRCQEPEMRLIRTEAREYDDYAFQDDSVELFLKPPYPAKDYFHFVANTAGVQFDQKNQDTTWNATWIVKCRIQTDCYTIEVAIPFSDLGQVAPALSQVWSVNFARNRTVTGKTETLVWSIPYGSLHTPQRFGRVLFE